MTEAIMRASLCRIGALLAATLALASSPSQVWAQAIPSGLEVKRVVNGVEEDVDPDPIVYATAADCDGSTTFLFKPTLYSIAAPVVEAWLAVGDGKDCRVPTNRTRQNTGSDETICKRLATNTDSSLKPTLSINGSDLFDGPGGEDGCDEVRGSPKYYVYIIPLDTATTEVSAAQAKSLGTVTTLVATFTPYTKLPDAPTSLSGIDGDSELRVSYDRPSTSNTYSTYRAYFDYGQSPDGGVGEDVDAGADIDAGTEPDASIDAGAEMDAGADLDAAIADAAGDATDEEDAGSSEGTTAPCGSGLLVGGRKPPSAGTPNLRITGKGTGDELALRNVDDIPKGTFVAVAVTSFDAAGNESLLSEPTCVEHIDTESYLEACDAGGNDCGLESCGLQIGRRRSSAFALIGLALAAAALLRRRRSA